MFSRVESKFLFDNWFIYNNLEAPAFRANLPKEHAALRIETQLNSAGET